MYNNNNRGYQNNRGNQNGSYYPQQQNFYPNQNNGYNQRQQQAPPKRSGAVYSKIRKGNFEGDIIVNAWRKTKFGLMTATCTPYSGQKGKGNEIVNSQKHEYQKMICVVQNTSMGTSNTYHVLMNIKSQVIVISELSLCITPNGSGVTSSGKRVTGYFGRNYKK